MCICVHFHTKKGRKKSMKILPTIMRTKCFHHELDSLVFQIPNYVYSPFATNAHKENPINNLNSH